MNRTVVTAWGARIYRRREAISVAAFSAGNALAGLAANRFLTEVVDPAALGRLYLQLNVALWITIPVASGYTYVVHHWAIARQLDKTRVLVRGMTRGLAIQGALAMLGALVLPAWPGLAIPYGTCTVAFIFVCVGQACAQTLGTVPSLERKRTLAGILDFCGSPLRLLVLAFGALHVRGAGHRLLQIHGMYSLLLLLLVVAAFRASHRAGASFAEAARPPIELNGGLISVRSFLAYSLPSLAGTLAGHASSSVERWGLARLASPGATAIFVQATGLASSGVAAFSGVITSYYYPVIMQAAARGGDAPLKTAGPIIVRYLALLVAVLGGLVVASTAYAHAVTRMTFGAKYAGACALLPWTVLGAALFVLGQALAVVPLTARATVGAAGMRVLSLGGYVWALLRFPHFGDRAASFARFYAGGQLIYVVAMLVLIASLGRGHVLAESFKRLRLRSLARALVLARGAR